MQEITPEEIKALYLKNKKQEEADDWLKRFQAEIDQTIEAIKDAAKKGEKFFYFDAIEFETERLAREEWERKLAEAEKRRRSVKNWILGRPTEAEAFILLKSEPTKLSFTRLGVTLYLQQKGFAIHKLLNDSFYICLDAPDGK